MSCEGVPVELGLKFFTSAVRSHCSNSTLAAALIVSCGLNLFVESGPGRSVTAGVDSAVCTTVVFVGAGASVAVSFGVDFAEALDCRGGNPSFCADDTMAFLTAWSKRPFAATMLSE